MSMSLENMKAKIDGIGTAIDAINAKKIVVPFESEAAAKIDEIKTKLDALLNTNIALTADITGLESARAKAEELLQKLNELIQIGPIKIKVEAEGI